MNLIELNRALRQLRLGGMAAVLETRLQQAQAEPMAPIDFLSCLVCDELTRRGDRLLERRRKQAQFRDPQVTFDNFDFDFNKKMNRSLVFDLATATFVARHEDALFLGPPGTGKSHLAQAIGKGVIGQGYRVIYREAHFLLEEIAEAAFVVIQVSNTTPIVSNGEKSVTLGTLRTAALWRCTKGSLGMIGHVPLQHRSESRGAAFGDSGMDVRSSHLFLVAGLRRGRTREWQVADQSYDSRDLMNRTLDSATGSITIRPTRVNGRSSWSSQRTERGERRALRFTFNVIEQEWGDTHA